MQTSKAISTISYNSKNYLDAVLDSLIRSHIIDYYMYIQHIGEDDGFGEKEEDHIHLYLYPNKRINTADLDSYFIEPVPNQLPRKCIQWNTSNPDDWILYVLHDPDYLLSKWEHRQIQYTFGKLKSSCKQTLRRLYRHAYQSSGYAKMKNIYQYAASNGNLADLMRIGAVPINQISSYEQFFTLAQKFNIRQDEIDRDKDQDG